MKFTGERMIPEINTDSEIYLEHMARYFFASQFAREKIVLDIACGSGYGSDYLLKAGAKKVWGIDISEEAISYCRKRYPNENLLFSVGTVGKIPLQEKKIDLVISMETIEHVDEITQHDFLKEVRRVIKYEGLFIVSTPNSLVYQTGNNFHIKEFILDEYELLLKQYFNNIKIYYQDNIESNFILLKDTLDSEILVENKKNIVLRKLNAILSSESLYFIAICSNSEIKHQINEYITIFNIKPWACAKKIINLQEENANLLGELNSLQNSIQSLQGEIAGRDAKIADIYQSLSWKLTSPLREMDRWLKIRNRSGVR